MPEFSINDVGVKVGLEIHQQLATNKKLFVIVHQLKLKNIQLNFKEN